MTTKLSSEITLAQRKISDHDDAVTHLKKKAQLYAKSALLTMLVHVDISRAGEPGTPMRAEFEDQLLKDLTLASGVPRDKILLKKLIVTKHTHFTVELLASEDDGTYDPQSVVGDLEKQAHNRSSALKQGKITMYVDGISLPTLEAESHRLLQEKEVMSSNLDEKQLRIDLLKAQNQVRDVAKDLETERKLRKQLEAAQAEHVQRTSGNKHVQPWETFVDDPLGDGSLSHTHTHNDTHTSQDTHTHQESEDLLSQIEKLLEEKRQLADDNARLRESYESQISELKSTVFHLEEAAPNYAALQAENIRLQLQTVQMRSTSSRTPAELKGLQDENCRLLQQVAQLKEHARVHLNSIPSPAPTSQESSLPSSKVEAAASDLWKKNLDLWGVCKLLITLTAPTDTTRIRKLQMAQDAQKSADDVVANFLNAIQGFNGEILQDATMLLDTMIVDKTPLTQQAFSNLCSSLISIPVRLGQIRVISHDARDASWDITLPHLPSTDTSDVLPRVEDRQSFGRDVVAKLPPPDHSYPSSRRESGQTHMNMTQQVQPKKLAAAPTAPQNLPSYGELTVSVTRQELHASPQPSPRSSVGALNKHDTRLSGVSAASSQPDLAGIGMLLLFDGRGKAFVKELVADGPADVDGSIHVGDELIAIDGVTTYGKTSNEVVDLIRGPNGSWIDVALYRQVCVCVFVCVCVHQDMLCLHHTNSFATTTSASSVTSSSSSSSLIPSLPSLPDRPPHSPLTASSQ